MLIWHSKSSELHRTLETSTKQGLYHERPMFPLKSTLSIGKTDGMVYDYFCHHIIQRRRITRQGAGNLARGPRNSPQQ